VSLGRDPVNGTHIRRRHPQLLAFESLDNFAHQTPFNAVGLDNYKGSIHDESI
jgi:hypothetical protein